MRYVLSIHALGKYPEVELDKSKYESLKKSRKVLSDALAMEEKYEILISNYLELEEEILNAKPDVVIIGTGKFDTMKVSNDVIKELESRSIEFIYANTDEACCRHNEISGSGKKVVTALHLTC